MARKGSADGDGRRPPVFIDLADYPVKDATGDKRVKVVRPSEATDLRSIRSYILSRIIVIVDLTSYAGDLEIAGRLINDSVSDCGGNVWTVNPEVYIAAPFDVAVDNGE